MGASILERARETAEAAQALPVELRWVLALSPGNLAMFREAVVAALQQPLSDHEARVFLDDWRATAEMDASPETVAELRRPKHFRPLSDFIKT